MGISTASPAADRRWLVDNSEPIQEEGASRSFRWATDDVPLRVIASAAVARGVVFTAFLIILAETYLRNGNGGVFWPWWMACLVYTLVTSLPRIAVKQHPRVSTLTTCADVILITILLYLTGGARSPYFALYILPVLQAGVRLRLRDALAAAGLSVISYTMLAFTGAATQTVQPVWYLQVAALAGLATFVALLSGLLVREMQERQSLFLQLQLVHQVSAEAQSSLVLDDLLTIAVESMHRHFHYNAVRIFLAPPDRARMPLKLVANAGARALAVADNNAIRQQAISSGKPLFAEGSDDQPDVACVPLHAGDKPVGVLEVEGADAAGPSAIRVPETLAKVLSGALTNAFLYRGTFIGAVSALTAAIDAKHSYTRGHSERVTKHALSIADQLGLDHHEKEALRLAGMLHDVGKIGSPEFILDKTGPLSESEWQTIRQHPARGAELVANIPGMGQVASIIRHHHERFDGTGYPDHLAADDIPLGARILALADAFDAMTSARAYKPRFPDSVARGELRRCAGTQFDPELVEYACRWATEGIEETEAEAAVRAAEPLPEPTAAWA